jgi:type IV pilus assembly protein PilZ
MAQEPASTAAPTSAKAGVMSLSIKEKPALHAAYMSFVNGGGLFIPTSRPYKLGDEVFMLMTLMDDPAKLAVAGKVVWITPAGAQNNRTQGIGVQFTQNENGIAARNKIEALLGSALGSNRPTHTM